jgi:hypothetical protein
MATCVKVSIFLCGEAVYAAEHQELGTGGFVYGGGTLCSRLKLGRIFSSWNGQRLMEPLKDACHKERSEQALGVSPNLSLSIVCSSLQYR